MAAPRKLSAQIVHIKKFDNSVTLFKLRPEGRYKFRSGQFLHLALDDYDPSYNWPDSRVFSIASAPGNSSEIEILVSPKGEFTQRMAKELRVGQKVWIKLPYGEFNFLAAQNKNVNLIAGGTGISPFVGYLQDVLQGKIRYETLNLYYGVKNPNLLVYDDLLKESLNSLADFHLHLYIEEGKQSDLFQSLKGIIPIKEIINHTYQNGNSCYFISGPQKMIYSFLKEATYKGINEENVFYDKWE